MYVCIISVIYLFNQNDIFIQYLFFISMMMLLYLMWILPYKVVTYDEYFQFTTIFRSKKINYSEIKSIYSAYSTSSMVWYAKDKSKAHFLAFVRFSSNPLGLLMLNNSIVRYYELLSFLEVKQKLKQKLGTDPN